MLTALICYIYFWKGQNVGANKFPTLLIHVPGIWICRSRCFSTLTTCRARWTDAEPHRGALKALSGILISHLSPSRLPQDIHARQLGTSGSG